MHNFRNSSDAPSALTLLSDKMLILNVSANWLEDEEKQEIVFKKDEATLHVISKRCEDRKHFL